LKNFLKLSAPENPGKSSSTNENRQLRMRVFAGPNGSGKSTVIEHVKNYKVNGRPVDFGYYINADEIARSLRESSYSFTQFDFTTTDSEFSATARASGLINSAFTETQFARSYSLSTNTIKLKDEKCNEQLAQIIADFLRKKLLQLRKRFSFETVFSHPSKLDVMKLATDQGYKVYLYFVSTEAPEINVFRVKARTEKGGHDVPEDKIVSRYSRSLDLLYDACQISYQTFFFDNSEDGKDSVMFAHFKKVGDRKQWDDLDVDNLPNWFLKYYINKV